MSIKGKVYPVQIQYIDVTKLESPRLTLNTVEGVHKEKLPGNILIFLECFPQVKSVVFKLLNALPDLSVHPGLMIEITNSVVRQSH